ncbi:MAG: heme d1 biosynthesis radical SAM protein NirJ [Azoarcus sp.]|jgi:heme d1 biosynthesis radical SAM protein NirJ|nr:heme d1 biosynthesis radical SAM protein NirJ [Azoarcus sp.]
MFRLSRFIAEIDNPTPVDPHRDPPAPVVIWNLTRRCNLTCKHCYAVSTDTRFPGELDTATALRVLEDLWASRVRVLILSGGEPLLRPDFFEIAQSARAMGFFVALSTNGTLIDERNIVEIAASDFDYVGISLDGMETTHDHFRQCVGAFAASLAGLRLCRRHGLKTGVRFTLTRQNAADLPALLDLVEREGVDRFYLSHLNYAGRGGKNRHEDAHFTMTRWTLKLLFERALHANWHGQKIDFTTGNNDADAIYFLHWATRRFPAVAEHLADKLLQWGGNASGINVANIDNLGNVHPDTMWWSHTLGNVRERSFDAIWHDESDPLLAGLKRRPRPVGGRCAACQYLPVCNGNTRIRALAADGDPWSEDPGCYLSDAEIGLGEEAFAATT